MEFPSCCCCCWLLLYIGFLLNSLYFYPRGSMLIAARYALAGWLAGLHATSFIILASHIYRAVITDLGVAACVCASRNKGIDFSCFFFSNYFRTFWKISPHYNRSSCRRHDLSALEFRTWYGSPSQSCLINPLDLGHWLVEILLSNRGSSSSANDTTSGEGKLFTVDY